MLFPRLIVPPIDPSSATENVGATLSRFALAGLTDAITEKMSTKITKTFIYYVSFRQIPTPSLRRLRRT
jgi:hypothetical protein